MDHSICKDIPNILNPSFPIDRVHGSKNAKTQYGSRGGHWRNSEARKFSRDKVTQTDPYRKIHLSSFSPSTRSPPPSNRPNYPTVYSQGWEIPQNNNTGNMVRRFSKFPKKPADWVAPSAPLAERKQVFLYVTTALFLGRKTLCWG